MAALTRQQLDTMIDNGDDITSADISEITDLSYLFFDNNLGEAKNIVGDITGWEVGHVTNMMAMFVDASSFNQNISSWNVSNVTNMNSMFYNCFAFNQDISGWNVSNVTNMRDMFNAAQAFNQDIGKWNVSNVTDMLEMFNGALAFNQNLTYWDVERFSSEPNMFSANTMAWESQYKPLWGQAPNVIPYEPTPINEAGGTVINSLGNVSLVIPALALSDMFYISITEDPDAVTDGYTKASPVYVFEPDGLSFDIPAQVTMEFSAETLTTPVIYWSTDVPGIYENIGGVVDGNTITASVTHFSSGFVGEGGDQQPDKVVVMAGHKRKMPNMLQRLRKGGRFSVR